LDEIEIIVEYIRSLGWDFHVRPYTDTAIQFSQCSTFKDMHSVVLELIDGELVTFKTGCCLSINLADPSRNGEKDIKNCLRFDDQCKLKLGGGAARAPLVHCPRDEEIPGHEFEGY
jgi:hypothetical protein